MQVEAGNGSRQFTMPGQLIAPYSLPAGYYESKRWLQEEGGEEAVKHSATLWFLDTFNLFNDNLLHCYHIEGNPPASDFIPKSPSQCRVPAAILQTGLSSLLGIPLSFPEANLPVQGAGCSVVRQSIRMGVLVAMIYDHIVPYSPQRSQEDWPTTVNIHFPPYSDGEDPTLTEERVAFLIVMSQGEAQPDWGDGAGGGTGGAGPAAGGMRGRRNLYKVPIYPGRKSLYRLRGFLRVNRILSTGNPPSMTPPSQTPHLGIPIPSLSLPDFAAIRLFQKRRCFHP
ncbi:hypothetical protein KFL_015810020 [Klebsormidium nitens]|uniref:Uncharacterized protein n=1 Tax=Klebsormidium nitens TaxID=105231 RepID=A0A1Y1IXK9_KLENI|nr:hypothetical protein KFL_015810020 [Klebsormidium nitens]|eukprot:GAQ93497.1 hypothetical protein KFL_015810020 [Klebsormidium nitens]